MQLCVDGLVIKETKVGDCDKIITLLTKEYGKISVSAKGSKNLKSKLLSGTQTFSFGNFALYYSRGRYSLNDVDLKESFFDIRLDVCSYALAGYICELASDLSDENEDSGNLLQLTLNALHLTAKKSKPNALIKAVYELRALSFSGFAPDLVACSECAVYEHEKMFFSVSEGKLWCGSCFGALEQKPLDATIVSPSVLYAMRYIIFSEDKKIFSFKMEQSALSELADICERYVISKAEHGYKTLEFYNGIKD